MFESLLPWLLLPLGFVLGWYWRRRSRGQAARAGDELPARAAFGAEVLVEGDESLALLIEATSGDARRAELQLLLGTLFRKRGEVDRALRLHQALVERLVATDATGLRARFELALDYVRAGVFDRAESLLLELADSSYRAPEALETVRGLYEQSHDWRQAYDINLRLQAVAGRDERLHGSHYACELAHAARARQDLESAQRWVATAADLAVDHRSARPWLLAAEMQREAGQLQKAARSLLRAAEADPRFIPEILGPLWTCFETRGDAEGFLRELENLGAEKADSPPSSAIALKQVELMESAELDALPLLVRAFSQRPAWLLLDALVERITLPSEAPLAPALESIQQALKQAARQRPRYRCEQCGLKPGQLLWQCPSCRNWGTILPVDDRVAA